MTRRKSAHVVILGIVIYAVWLLLSGHFTPFFLVLGLLCTALVVYIAIRMEMVDEEGVPVIHLTWRIWAYLVWLIREIALSNVAVARIILQRSMPIQPAMVRVRGAQETDLGRVIFANSITLTPGTVTLGVAREHLHVHALDAGAAAGLDSGEMNRRVAGLERKLRVEE